MPGGGRVEFVSGGDELVVIRVVPAAGGAGLHALRGFVPGQEVRFGDVLRAGLKQARQIDVVAAFVMASGVDEIAGDLEGALTRGAKVQVLTGDSLTITEPEALARLLVLMGEFERLTVKLYCCPPGQTFHAKAYVFVADDETGVAYVGSSNLSRSALNGGIEWNLRAIEAQVEFAEIQARFARLWGDPLAKPLTPTLLAEYRERRALRPQMHDPADLPPPRPRPHAIQVEALMQLKLAREEGKQRGLVVMATGLGKTLLSAFDFAATGWRRGLFVAHRAEILEQAMAAWGRVVPDRSLGRWFGGKRETGAEVVFASIQALTHPAALEGLDLREFDYVVIDEFHHAAAATYRTLLGRIAPRYLLGLTATPERGDGAELLALCDRNLVYRAGLRAGLTAGLLVPFHYFAVPDEVNYEPIPWRSGRFDEAALTAALATQEHAAAALAALDARTSRETRRALIFCCSVAHADFMAGFLREQGIAAAAVHSGPTSAPRAEALRRFKAGELVALTAVDLFNEGLDVPDIDAVLMLRPTESPVVFLQQIGRGLRIGRERAKPRLTVVDLVGNHHSSLAKLDALRALLDFNVSRAELLRTARAGAVGLPPGCALELPTEIVELMRLLCVREREAESRAAVLATIPPFLLKVIHNDRNPILILDRARRPETPEDEVEVEVDGETYVLRFSKIAVNVAFNKGSGTKKNVLPEILRGWFGAQAGWGKDFVTLSRRGDGWRLDPVRGAARSIRHGVPLYRDLAVACGVGPLMHGEPEAEVAAIRASIEIDPRRHFVVRAEGDSMDGGEAPIRNGDLVLCEWARDVPLAEVAGRVCVLTIHAGPELAEVVLKTPIQVGAQWILRSQAPETPDRVIEAGAEVRVIARAIETVFVA